MLISEMRAAERAFDQAFDQAAESKSLDAAERASARLETTRMRFVCSTPATHEEAALRLEYLLDYHVDEEQELHSLKRPLEQIKNDLLSKAPVPDLAFRIQCVNEAASSLTDDPAILALVASICERLLRPTPV